MKFKFTPWFSKLFSKTEAEKVSDACPNFIIPKTPPLPPIEVKVTDFKEVAQQYQQLVNAGLTVEPLITKKEFYIATNPVTRTTPNKQILYVEQLENYLKVEDDPGLRFAANLIIMAMREQERRTLDHYLLMPPITQEILFNIQYRAPHEYSPLVCLRDHYYSDSGMERLATMAGITPQQWASLQSFCNKWNRVIKNSALLDKEKAITSINLLYDLHKLPHPKVWFFSNPASLLYAKCIWEDVVKDDTKCLTSELIGKTRLEIATQFSRVFNSQLDIVIKGAFEKNLINYTIWLSEIMQVLANLDQLTIIERETIFQSTVKDLEKECPYPEYSQILTHAIYQDKELSKRIRDSYEKLIKNEALGFQRNIVERQNQMSMENGNEMSYFFFGNYECAKFSICNYYSQCLNQPITPALQAILACIENCGWMIPHNDVCFVCERPIVRTDDLGRLHGDPQIPSIQFPNGFNLYHNQGRRIPSNWGMLPREQWKTEWVFNAKNTELRAVALRVIGYEKVLDSLQGFILDEDNEKGYKLIAADIIRGKPITKDDINNGFVERNFMTPVHRMPSVFLVVTCPSTGKKAVLPVPRAAVRWTCEQARQWTFGIDNPEKDSITFISEA